MAREFIWCISFESVSQAYNYVFFEQDLLESKRRWEPLSKLGPLDEEAAVQPHQG